MEYNFVYITSDEFLAKCKRQELYIGFVIGVGYAYLKNSSLRPHHLHGYTLVNDPNICITDQYVLKVEQLLDSNQELIKMSLKGLFRNGTAKYTVQTGDSLLKIASLFDVTIEQLVKWNHIQNKDFIPVGQELIIHDNDYIHQFGEKNKSDSGTSLTNENKLRFTDSSLELISSFLLNLASGGIDIYTSLPNNKKFLYFHGRNEFVGTHNGTEKVWKNGFRGNNSVTGNEVNQMKETFHKKIKWIEGADKWGKRLSGAQIGMSVINFFEAENKDQRFEAALNIIDGMIQFTGYGITISIFGIFLSPVDWFPDMYNNSYNFDEKIMS